MCRKGSGHFSWLDFYTLDVYQRMSDVGDYDLLKNSLLKRFKLSEEGYRKDSRVLG